jgi:hypothetical protein
MSDTTNHYTPAEALAAWERADARKRALEKDLAEAISNWREWSKRLADAIERAGFPANNTVLIGKRIVTVERHSGVVLVEVQTPPVLG